jgi:phosphatidylserine/phosphatidylglycerophosphate/cardiolipin synthase-like enzyme
VAYEHWQLQPDNHDYPAAASYLSLICDVAMAERLVVLLEGATSTIYLAKDLLRASGLALLDKNNAHVAKDLNKVRNGRKLSPVLLVRGDFPLNRSLVVADGYHRICASHWIDEDAPIPCRVADLPN